MVNNGLQIVVLFFNLVLMGFMVQQHNIGHIGSKVHEWHVCELWGSF